MLRALSCSAKISWRWTVWAPNVALCYTRWVLPISFLMFFFNPFIWFFQWNISDYFYQQRAKISADIVKDADPSLTSSDQLWMCLYSKFGELCVDSRPAVRKSAGQTLFSTIAAHGDLLQLTTWKPLLWKVRFEFSHFIVFVSLGHWKDFEEGF